MPYWILGMLLGSAVSVFMKDRIHNTFRSLQGKRLGIAGIVFAAISTPKASFPPNSEVMISAGTYRWNRADSTMPKRKYFPVAFTFRHRFFK